MRALDSLIEFAWILEWTCEFHRRLRALWLNKRQASRHETKTEKRPASRRVALSISTSMVLRHSQKTSTQNPLLLNTNFFALPCPSHSHDCHHNVDCVWLEEKAHGKGTKLAETRRYLARRKRLTGVLPSPMRCIEIAALVKCGWRACCGCS